MCIRDSTTGSAFTVTAAVVLLQFVVASVNVKVTLPAATPLTVLPLTVAFEGSLLTHVPPVAGVNVIVLPIHTEVAEVLTTGSAFTVTAAVVLLQFVVASVNVKVTLPAATPLTVLPLTVAFEGSLLTHVPPVAGVN